MGVRMEGRQLRPPAVRARHRGLQFPPTEELNPPNSSSGHPAGWGRTVCSRESPKTTLGSAQHPPMAQGRGTLQALLSWAGQEHPEGTKRSPLSF